MLLRVLCFVDTLAPGTGRGCYQDRGRNDADAPLGASDILQGHMEGRNEMTRFPEVEVELSGHDGNAFAIIGTIRRELHRAGATTNEMGEFVTEATSGDYDHLLQTMMQWVNVT